MSDSVAVPAAGTEIPPGGLVTSTAAVCERCGKPIRTQVRDGQRQWVHEPSGRVECRQRSQRSDTGTTRLLGRDAAALAWLWDMRAIREDDLGVLLGRLGSGRPLAPSGAAAVVQRWERLGVAQAERILAGQPRVVTLTERGAQLINPERRYSPPVWSQLAHVTATARVRLWVEGQNRPGEWAEWISERRYRMEHDDRVKAGGHVPDALFQLANGQTWAIEVELTQKPMPRSVKIITELMTDTTIAGTIFYAGSEQVARHIRAAVEAAGPSVAAAPVRPRPVDVHLVPTPERLREQKLPEAITGS